MFVLAVFVCVGQLQTTETPLTKQLTISRESQKWIDFSAYVWKEAGAQNHSIDMLHLHRFVRNLFPTKVAAVNGSALRRLRHLQNQEFFSLREGRSDGPETVSHSAACIKTWNIPPEQTAFLSDNKVKSRPAAWHLPGTAAAPGRPLTHTWVCETAGLPAGCEPATSKVTLICLSQKQHSCSPRFCSSGQVSAKTQQLSAPPAVPRCQYAEKHRSLADIVPPSVSKTELPTLFMLVRRWLSFLDGCVRKSVQAFLVAPVIFKCFFVAGPFRPAVFGRILY